MSLDLFAEALLPDHRSACGVALRPFCIGHALLLHRLGNPVIAAFTPAADRLEHELPEIGRGDLLVAAWICSRPYAEAVRRLDSRPMLWWLSYRRFGRIGHLVTGRLAILQYLAAAHRPPPIRLTEEPKGEPCGAPWLAALVATLMGRYHMGLDAALETPLAAAQWLFALDLEREGAFRIQNGADESFAAAAEEARRKAGEDPAAILDMVARAQKDAGIQPEGKTP